MMISKNKTSVWANVPLPIKERLEALRKVDPVIYSESRVIWKCLETGLPLIEQEVETAQVPLPGAHRRRRRSA